MEGSEWFIGHPELVCAYATSQRTRKRIDRRIQSTPRCKDRYNPAANAVYQARRECGDPFEPRFEHHIITGLKEFDMG